MTRHDAIKHLSYKIAYYKSVNENWADAVNIKALEMATIALQKQEPMTVRAHQLCPSCGKDVIGSGYYCWHCGQHLKWENKNDGEPHN